MVQSVSSRLCACIYEARPRLFHMLFNTNVENLIRHSPSLVPKLILSIPEKGKTLLPVLKSPRDF